MTTSVPSLDASPLQGSQHYICETHLYTWVEKGIVRVVSCPRTQHKVPGQVSRQLDLEMSALTMRPPYLPDLLYSNMESIC